MAVSFPKAARAAAIQLLRLPVESQQELLSELESTQPIYTPEGFSKQLRPELLNKGVDEIVRLLFAVYSLVETTISPKKLANDLFQSLRNLEGETVAQASGEEISNFRQFFSRALSLHSTLGVSAKALRLMRQHHNIYGRAEIFSDIRSVFPTDMSSLRPEAGVIVHQLKIHTHTSEVSEDIYVAMDYNDLVQLKKTVERALTKHKSLVEMIKTFDLRHQEISEEEK